MWYRADVFSSSGIEQMSVTSSDTEHILVAGFAIYTGQDTKISLNFMTGKAKFSRIEK